MKTYLYIISTAVIVTILSVYITGELNGDYYKLSPQEIHEFSINQEFTINTEELNVLKEPYLLIHLAEKSTDNSISDGDEMHIRPSDILLRSNRKIYKNSALIMLTSDNLEVAAGAWAILSRKGYSNIRILDNNSNTNFNYVFQPDSEAGPK